VRQSLARIATHCRWTDGVWEELGWAWNEVQNTGRHIAKLSEYLMRLDRNLSRPTK
jgi:hypothetical protein